MKYIRTLCLSLIAIVLVGTTHLTPLRAQSFEVSTTTVDLTGPASDPFTPHVDLKNLTSRKLDIRILITKYQIPTGWFYSMCLHECWGEGNYDVYDWLEGNETASFKPSFDPSGIPGEALVELRISLADDPGEFYEVTIRVKATSTTSVVKTSVARSLALAQNYPNPFSLGSTPSTTITYSLPRTGAVSLKVYSLLGTEVRTLVQGLQELGPHAIQWDGRDNNGSMLPPGVYLYKLSAGRESQTRRVQLTR